jgi:tetratricopeptide (TPR) repeat protein
VEVAAGTVLWLVLGIAAILLIVPTFGASLVPLVVCIYKYFHLVNEARKREINRQREADRLLARILHDHRLKACSTYCAARSDIDASDFARALNKLDECKELGIPFDALAEGFAFVYFKSGDFIKAIPFLEKHVAKKRGTDIFHEMLVESYLADELKSDGAVQYCLDCYKSLRSELKHRTVFRLAIKFAQTQRNDDVAIEILLGAFENDPTDPRHLSALAGIYNSRGKPEEAIKLCSSFSGMHSKESLGEFTRALDALNRIDEMALQVYRERLALEPRDSGARMRLCQGLVRANQLTSAVDILREGLTLEPSDLRLRYHLALTLLRAGNIDETISECQRLMHQPSFEAYKSRPELHLLLGKCFAMKKLFSPALKQYRLAGQTGEVVERLYELGELAESMGDSDTAGKCWEEICTVDITFKDVKTKLAPRQ